MANFLGSTYVNEPVQSSINLPLIQSVLAAKQGQYDTNKAKIQSGLEQLSQLQVLRPQDKEYIQAKMQDITTKINNYGENDLSQSFVADDMFGMIKSAARDPFILSAIENTTKLSKVNAEVAEKKKKGDGSYNDLNYNDMLEQAGYYDYISGKRNDLGSLNYTDYKNVPKELNDAVSKWAKDNGYQKSVSEEQGEYYIKQTTKEKLSKEEILNYVDTIIDPSMKAQIQINTRATYGKMKDSDFNAYAEKRYTQQNKIDELKLQQYKAEKSTKSGAEADYLNSKITDLETKLENRKNKISSKSFNRDEQYNFYQEDLFGGIAEAYDRDTITDIKYDTVILDIKKYELDKDYKEKDLILKAEANALKRGEISNSSTGTAIPTIPEDLEGEEKTAVDKVKDSFVQTESQLKNVLAKEDPEYKKLDTVEKRNAYVRGLMSGKSSYNMNAEKPLSQNVILAVQNHKNNYSAYSKYVNSLTTNLDKTSAEDYNEMLGAKDLNVNNLAKTMPYTANFLKSKKSFDSLTKGQQDLIRYERASNQLQYDNDLGEKDRESLVKYTNQIKARNYTNKGFNDRINKMSTEEVGGYWSNLATRFAGAVNTVFGVPINIAIRNASYLPNKWAYGTDYANEQYSDWEKGAQKMNNYRDWSETQYNKMSEDYFGGQDTNITEVDTYTDTKSGRNIALNYRNKLSQSVKESNRLLEEYLPKLPEKISFSFSTTDKGQAFMASQLGQVVQKQTGVVPGKGQNNYNLEYFANNKAYKISYVDAKGNSKTTDFINENLIPREIRDKYTTGLTNWSVDVKNKNATLPEYHITPPKNEDEAENMLNKLSDNTYDAFTSKQLGEIRNKLVLTPEEKKEDIYETYPTLKTAKIEEDGVIKYAKDEVEKLSKASITIKSQLYPDSHFVLYPEITFPDNTKKVLNRNKYGDILVSIQNFDPKTHLAKQMEVAANAYQFELNKIVARYTQK